MTYTDADLQNLSRSNDELVRTIAARYYVERGDLRTKLADAEKRGSQMKAIADAAVKWRQARRDLPDSQLSGDPNDETVAFALYDTAIRELQKAVSELEQLKAHPAEAQEERTTVVCEDTGRMARDGECPEHHGDACLYDVSAMREAVNQNTSLRVQLREAEKSEFRGCPCTLTKPCMDVCSCANMVHSGGCLRCCRYGSEEQGKARAEIIADAEKAAKAVTDWDPLFLQSLILDPQQKTIAPEDREKFWQDIANLREALKD